MSVLGDGWVIDEVDLSIKHSFTDAHCIVEVPPPYDCGPDSCEPGDTLVWFQTNVGPMLDPRDATIVTHPGAFA